MFEPEMISLGDLWEVYLNGVYDIMYKSNSPQLKSLITL